MCSVLLPEHPKCSPNTQGSFSTERRCPSDLASLTHLHFIPNPMPASTISLAHGHVNCQKWALDYVTGGHAGSNTAQPPQKSSPNESQT